MNGLKFIRQLRNHRYGTIERFDYMLSVIDKEFNQLVYCLQHYDELMQQLNDELDNCNYFGENYDNSRC